MKCTSPTVLWWLADKNFPQGRLAPCGKCLPCKRAKSAEWTLRLTHEMKYWDDALFVTLTYDDEHLPSDKSVSKVALQKFFKRLRKILSYNKRIIRYYACGEYGDRNDRPHYHAIIYGLSFKEHSVHNITKNVIGGPLYSSWGLGNVQIGDVNEASCRYVTQYIDKKLYGDLEDEVYKKTGRINPFQLSSQAMGLRFVHEEAERLAVNLSTTLHGIQHSLPRYYLNKLNVSKDVLLEKSIDYHQDQIIYWLNRGKKNLLEVLQAQYNGRKTKELELKTKYEQRARLKKIF